jgi:hypothetical protein
MTTLMAREWSARRLALRASARGPGVVVGGDRFCQRGHDSTHAQRFSSGANASWEVAAFPLKTRVGTLDSRPAPRASWWRR